MQIIFTKNDHSYIHCKSNSNIKDVYDTSKFITAILRTISGQ